MSLYSGSKSDISYQSLSEERCLKMHKSYQSILPCQNKLLQKRWDKTYYEEHRRKVANVTPIVDNKAPQTFMHLHLKLKKLKLEEDRLDTIERDNRMLLEKMAYIMRTKGRVDNYYGYPNKSLNAEKREREQLRISVENKNILRRIISRQPVYSHRTWLDDWRKNRALLNNISHFPNEWWKTGKSNGQRRMVKEKISPNRGTGNKKISRPRKDSDNYSEDYEDDEGETDTGTMTEEDGDEMKDKKKEEEEKKNEEEEKDIAIKAIAEANVPTTARSVDSETTSSAKKESRKPVAEGKKETNKNTEEEEKKEKNEEYSQEKETIISNEQKPNQETSDKELSENPDPDSTQS